MPKNHRILYFSTQFPNLRSPSMAVFSLQRVLALRRAGCEVLVVSPLLLNPPPGLLLKPGQAYAWVRRQVAQPSELRYHEISACYPRWICPPKKVFGWSMGDYLFWQVRNKVRALASAFGPDVILSSWLPDGVAAAKLGEALRIPVLAIADGTDVNTWPEEYRGWRSARAILNDKTAAIIFVSEALRQVGLSKGLHGKKNIVLHNAVDTHLFTPGGSPGKAQVFTILGVGRLLPNKGFQVLLDAFAEFIHGAQQPARLILVGDGPQREALIQQAAALDIGAWVEFTGPIAPENMVQVYQAADVFCLPSFHEGFPCVVIEALACGKPVVASRVGGIAEGVDAESGILVAPGDARALCQALLQAKARVWDGEAIRKKMVEKFSFERWAAAMIELMDTTTG